MGRFGTMILRFRDLVTENDETIKNHCEVITKYGYVWWAWWKKGHEVTPFDEFAILGAKARSNPLKIFLVDSGQRKVYKAICEAIDHNKDNKIFSPEKEKTPNYYNERNYHAWFKFSEIEECSSDELRKYSYVNIDTLFKDGDSDYKKFDGKRIYGVNELIQQNRTVWFAREVEVDDLDFEIVLLNANFIEPHNFSSKYYECESNTLLWLSDLHFAENNYQVHKTPTNVTLQDHILKALDDNKISGLIITGDITSCGKKEGFETAKKFISELNYTTSSPTLNSENIIFCPGNHDLNWMNKKLGDDDPEYVSNNPDSFKDYSEFYHSVYNLYPNKFIACGRKFLLESGRTVEIASLNSLLLQQYEDFEGHGYLSQEQLDFVAANMGWDGHQENSSVRIVIMHHHYLPTCFKELIETKRSSSVVYDADRLMQWLIKHNVKILLHGHKHQSFLSQINYPKDPHAKDINFEDLKKINVIGMGGTGSNSQDNKFATITFNTDNLELKYYKIFKDNSSSDTLSQTIKIKI